MGDERVTDQSSAAALPRAQRPSPRERGEKPRSVILSEEMRQSNAEATAFGQEIDELSRGLRAYVDVSEPAADLVQTTPDGGLTEGQSTRAIQQTREFRYGIRIAREQLGPMKDVVLALSSTTASTSITVIASSVLFAGAGEPKMAAAKERYLASVARLPLLDDAYELFARFGLDTSAHGRSASDMLREAERALMGGAHDAQAIAGVLFGLRNVIDTMLPPLLRRRIEQEKPARASAAEDRVARK